MGYQATRSEHCPREVILWPSFVTSATLKE